MKIVLSGPDTVLGGPANYCWALGGDGVSVPSWYNEI